MLFIHFLVEKYFFDTGSYFQPANKKKKKKKKKI